MRLDELTIPKGMSSAVHVLMKNGYEMLGRPGAWGKVFRKQDTNYVLKLYENVDVAYTTYINLCRSHTNPYLPKVIGKVLRVTDHYSAVRLEPLQPAPDWSDRLSALVTTTMRYIKTINYEPPDWSSPFAMEIADVRDVMEGAPALKEACDLIASLVPPYELDLGPYNIMMRGKQFVFSDPLKIVP